MKPVFADTYVALLAQFDAHHNVAVGWSERILGRVIVTEYVLIELGSMLSGQTDRHLYVPSVEEILSDPGTMFIPASVAFFRQGLDLFRNRPDKEWSLVDCISFIVMKQRRVTTDHHFKQAGFSVLLA